MQSAQLFTKTASGALRCDACQWYCELESDVTGRCLVRRGADNHIALLNHGLISAASISPIEDHRLWHFFPESRALAIGGWGYAFPADQQRGAYAHIPDDPTSQRRIDADRIANVALEQLCRGVIWAYGEPAVSHEYVLDVMQLSRAASRYTALVTTGYMTAEALDRFGPYLDGINLDLRGFSDSSYSRLAIAPHWRGILEIATYAHSHWHCHIEVTTRVHNGVNDDANELLEMVEWIRDTLGEQTPWHVLPGDAGAATASSVIRARRVGYENGLQFVYGPDVRQDTRCPDCQTILIRREQGFPVLAGLDGNRCQSCGKPVNMRISIFHQK